MSQDGVRPPVQPGPAHATKCVLSFVSLVVFDGPGHCGRRDKFPQPLLGHKLVVAIVGVLGKESNGVGTLLAKDEGLVGTRGIAH